MLLSDHCSASELLPEPDEIAAPALVPKLTVAPLVEKYGGDVEVASA